MPVRFDFCSTKGKLMKPIHLLAAFAFSMSGLAFAAGGHDHDHEHKPLHGGVVSEVKDMDYELVAKPDLIQLYLRDHGKPVDVSKTNAKLTILVGADKQEVELKPAGQQLEARQFQTCQQQDCGLGIRSGQSPGNGSLRVEVEGRSHVCDYKNTRHLFSGRDALRLCRAYPSTAIGERLATRHRLL
jgi:hypothetical protein